MEETCRVYVAYLVLPEGIWIMAYKNVAIHLTKTYSHETWKDYHECYYKDYVFNSQSKKVTLQNFTNKTWTFGKQILF